MKRFLLLVFLLGALIQPWLLTLCASADTTTLTALVPSEVMLSLEISGKGTVTIEGVSYSKSTSIPVQRCANQTVQISPAAGYALGSVCLDDENVTAQLEDGVLIIREMLFDADLCVEFVKRPSVDSGENPVTGDPLRFWSILFGDTMAVLLLHLVRKNRTDQCKA